MLANTQHPSRIPRGISRTAMARDVFRKYKTEQKEEIRKLDIRKDEIFIKLREIWRKFEYVGPLSTYDEALGLIKDLIYSSKDVENFSIALAEFQDEKNFGVKAGLFLSAMINNGRDENYVVHTEHLTLKISELGFRNIKKIVVEGDVSYGLGFDMISGNILVKGNVLDYAASKMKGGNIIIEGNAGKCLGRWMTGGKIIVKGDVSDNTGLDMNGGFIVVEGNTRGHIGICMIDGVISIEGNSNYDLNYWIKHWAHGGKVYYKGEIVFSKELDSGDFHCPENGWVTHNKCRNN